MIVGRVGAVPQQFLWAISSRSSCGAAEPPQAGGAHLPDRRQRRECTPHGGERGTAQHAIVFARVGLAAALGGFLFSVEVPFFWPTLGEGYLLHTLAPVFLGGTSVFGGVAPFSAPSSPPSSSAPSKPGSSPPASPAFGRS